VWNDLGADFASDVFGTVFDVNGARTGAEMVFPGADRTPQHLRESPLGEHHVHKAALGLDALDPPLDRGGLATRVERVD
jgi:hypothetical protein